MFDCRSQESSPLRSLRSAGEASGGAIKLDRRSWRVIERDSRAEKMQSSVDFLDERGWRCWRVRSEARASWGRGSEAGALQSGRNQHRINSRESLNITHDSSSARISETAERGETARARRRCGRRKGAATKLKTKAHPRILNSEFRASTLRIVSRSALHARKSLGARIGIVATKKFVKQGFFP